MKTLPQISEAEYEVMRIVWKYTPINTNEVTDKLTKTTEWSPKTIHTLLKRLVNKGALTYEKEGRIFVYTPLVQEEEYINEQSTSFLNRFFSGNVTSMLSSFLDHDQLSPSEINELRSLLSEKAQKEERS
ncbi:MAG: BlaI/MecI/CopY family transcriptional regulator [Anaerobutyricum sp.]|nr:BlaI/MecI/CopY family transcriptional regulator [Eubacterium sp.]MDY6045959.1 BlaI/MecI/CopY family transcriptional regulator [Anaerobutyricum sp.]